MDYHSLIKKNNPLTVSEEKSLFTIYEKAKPFLRFNRYGELVGIDEQNNLVAPAIKAREKIILSNLRLVAKIINKPSYQRELIAKEDLFSLGVLGLTKACDRFTLSKNCKFSTYATYLIFQQIRNSLYTAFDYKLSTKEINLSWLVAKTKLELSKTGKDVSYQDLALFLGLSIDRVKELDFISSKAKRKDPLDIEQSSLADKPYFDTDILVYEEAKEYLNQLRFLSQEQKDLLLSYIDNLFDYPLPTPEVQQILDLISLFLDTSFNLIYDHTHTQITRNRSGSNRLSDTQSSVKTTRGFC